MKKLLDGIIDFRNRVRPAYAETFARLALGQTPDCLMIACSDSRVAPNLFASTDPGDMFVVRNVGNFVTPFDVGGGAGAAVEFATQILRVRDIVVVGHSSCGAMHALLEGGVPDSAPTLRTWLERGRSSVSRLHEPIAPDLPVHDRLSQINVLEQLRNLLTYPDVAARVAAGDLGLHAWWFDIAHAEVLAWHEAVGRFEPILVPSDA